MPWLVVILRRGRQSHRAAVVPHPHRWSSKCRQPDIISAAARSSPSVAADRQCPLQPIATRGQLCPIQVWEPGVGNSEICERLDNDEGSDLNLHNRERPRLHRHGAMAVRQDDAALEREFEALAALIRQVGTVKPWPRDAVKPVYHHPYLELDGWEYWTMGAPIVETTVINRA